jgi:hypothetical protein
MNITLSLSEAQTHSKEFEKIVKHIKVDPQDIKWGYFICVEVSGCSFQDVLDEMSSNEPIQPKTLQERLDDIIPNVGCSLYGKYKRKSKYISLEVVPEKVIDYYRELFEKDIEEETRIASLTPEEHQKEIEGLLAELRKDPGFMEFRIDGDVE